MINNVLITVMDPGNMRFIGRRKYLEKSSVDRLKKLQKQVSFRVFFKNDFNI